MLRKPLRHNKLGQQTAFIWLVALIAIFVVGVLYVVLSRPHQIIADTVEPSLTGDYLTTFNKIKAFWFLWPLIVIPAVIIWMYVSSLAQRQVGPPPF